MKKLLGGEAHTFPSLSMLVLSLSVVDFTATGNSNYIKKLSGRVTIKRVAMSMVN